MKIKEKIHYIYYNSMCLFNVCNTRHISRRGKSTITKLAECSNVNKSYLVNGLPRARLFSMFSPLAFCLVTAQQNSFKPIP